jgi:undecaprenol kinase
MKEWHKSRSFGEALKHSWDGLMYVIQQEANIRRHLLVGMVVVLLGIVLPLPPTHLVILIVVSILVISLEIVNAALELIEDVIHPEYHSAFKYSKDMMAAAVLIASIGAVATGIVLLGPSLLDVVR